MSRYLFTAIALKTLGSTSYSRSLYKKLGNRIGYRRRTELTESYVRRGVWLLEHLTTLRLTDRNVTFLELGTGWMHFYSIFIRLFFDFRGVLYDVWDNRQLEPLKSNFEQLADWLPTLACLSPNQRMRAREIIDQIASVESFDALYRLLNLEYVVDASATLSSLPRETYDIVFSFDVLEHVRARSLAQSISNYHRVLKPGGYSIHQVGVDDHLSHYAPSASPKRYQAFSDMRWKLFYENQVQYFNRVSYDEFRRLFLDGGFDETETYVDRSPAAFAGLKIASNYRHQTKESLEAVRAYLFTENHQRWRCHARCDRAKLWRNFAQVPLRRTCLNFCV